MKPKIIGQDGDLIVVQTEKDYIVGFRPIDEDTYNEWTDPDELCDDAVDYLKDIWQMSVAERCCEDSLRGYATDAVATNGGECFWDYSYCELWDVLRDAGFNEEAWPVFTCVMCGYYGGKKYEKFNLDSWGDKK